MPRVVNENLSTEFGKHYGSRDAAEKSNLKKRDKGHEKARGRESSQGQDWR